mmetsp:Transcript_11102/g.29606  ORF Transcript_11102/g.29606 Transcript_11102/m.29606 type:complete len:240 (+) Transcript_11102:1063-1782(+)
MADRHLDRPVRAHQRAPCVHAAAAGLPHCHRPGRQGRGVRGAAGDRRGSDLHGLAGQDVPPLDRQQRPAATGRAISRGRYAQHGVAGAARLPAAPGGRGSGPRGPRAPHGPQLAGAPQRRPAEGRGVAGVHAGAAAAPLAVAQPARTGGTEGLGCREELRRIQVRGNHVQVPARRASRLQHWASGGVDATANRGDPAHREWAPGQRLRRPLLQFPAAGFRGPGDRPGAWHAHRLDVPRR